MGSVTTYIFFFGNAHGGLHNDNLVYFILFCVLQKYTSYIFGSVVLWSTIFHLLSCFQKIKIHVKKEVRLLTPATPLMNLFIGNPINCL